MALPSIGGPTRAPAVPAPRARCLIAGQWVPGDGEVKKTVGPYSGDTVTTVGYATKPQIDAAVAAAKAAQDAWAATTMGERARVITAALDAVASRADEIARWITLEMGKTITEAREEVVDITLEIARAAVEDARRFGGATRPAWSAGHARRRVHTIYQPIGVTGFISPWNFPVEMVANCVAALMMGNTCVWKPSEWAPYAPQLLVEAFASADLPPGVLNLVYGGPETGEQLVTHPDLGLLAFIGSTAVGEQIASAAGVKRLLLELGGNGPLIVLDDADVDAAVNATVDSCFYMAGQVCTSAERIVVHSAVHDEFVAKLTARAAALTVGDPLDESTDMGPISEARILAKIVDHIADARAKGATITTGGRASGHFHEPTVLTGVTRDMRIYQEETFGPVAPVIKVDSASEALAIANDSEYGLSMAVFTSSLTTAYEMSEGLQAGSVAVNAGTNDWELGLPFGGYKKSGIGRELGEDALRAFTNVKSVSITLL